MKNTKYFKTVQDVNNYYPDGVPSNVIAIVGDGSNVFISSDNAASGNQQYYSAEMTNDEIVADQVQAAEQQGYDTGYAAGQAAAIEWEPIGDAVVDMPLLHDIINGTVDSIDLYWGQMYGNLSIEGITDQESGDVVGYRYEWDESPADVDTGETDPETGDIIYDSYTIHVIHEEYPDPETGEYVQADGIPANEWFDFMFNNDGVITDLYQFVYPVMRNVTLEAAPQGADYDYILRFETLASTNDHSTICVPVEQVEVNGFYPANNFCAFNVNVEGGGSSTPTPEELDQQAYLFFTQGPGYENTNEVMNYAWGCGTQVCDMDTMDGELYKGYLSNSDSFENLDAPYNIYITLYDTTQTPEFQWGTYSGYLTPSYNVYTDGTTGWPIVTVTFTPSNDCKVGFGLLPINMDVESGDLTRDPDLAPISTFLKCFDNGETDEWDNAIYRHLTDVKAGVTYQATFSVGESPYADAVAEFSFTEFQR